MIPPRHRFIRTTLSVVFASGLALGLAPAAQAGDYTVQYCQPGKALQDFTASFRGGTGTATSTCSTGGTIRVRMDPTTGPGIAALVATPPAGLSPTYLRAAGSLAFDIPAGKNLYGGITYDECFSSRDTSCASGKTRTLTVDRAIPADAGLTVFVRCDQPFDDPAGCGNSSGQVDVTKFDVTYRDSAAPAGSATLSALVPSAAGDPVGGTQLVPYAVTDTVGSGIQRVEGRIAGQPIAATPDQCAAPFDRMQPCPTSSTGNLAVDTTKLPDGAHALSVVAIDASGNEATIAASTIVTQNSSSVGRGSDPALRGAVNGSYAADDAKLSAFWPATARTASKNKTIKRRCQASKAYRRKNKVACDGRPPSDKLRVSYSKRKSNLVRGRLVTPAGDPVSEATIRIVATPNSSGATPSTAATTVTDAAGRFKALLPVAVGSATYGVQWAARVRDTVPVASARLTRAVRADSSISVTPSRVVYRRQRLVFSGKLSGTTGTPKGTAVLVQVNAGKGWRALTTVRARPSGRWTAPYRVLPQLRGRYRFRALVKPSAAYAYASGASRSLPVRVR